MGSSWPDTESLYDCSVPSGICISISVGKRGTGKRDNLQSMTWSVMWYCKSDMLTCESSFLPQSLILMPLNSKVLELGDGPFLYLQWLVNKTRPLRWILIQQEPTKPLEIGVFEPRAKCHEI